MAQLEASLPMYGPGIVDDANETVWTELRERLAAASESSCGTYTYFATNHSLDHILQSDFVAFPVLVSDQNTLANAIGLVLQARAVWWRF
jgi:hypothetical protein